MKTPERLTCRIDLQTPAGVEHPERLVARFLKMALRSYGLKALRVEFLDGDQAQTVTPDKNEVQT